jgi:hypothetical protein
MSSLLSPETRDSAKIIARSLFREMKAHGYELLQMVTLLSELMDLMTAEHERLAVGAVPQDKRGLPAAHDASHPVSARQAASSASPGSGNRTA